MNDIYYIIGTAYAGKSTMVKRLADKYDGIACEENYHDRLVDEKLDKNEFPCLCYTRDLQDWREFIRRTPDEYVAWLDGVAAECEILELRILDELKKQGKKIFVDTNISIETLKKISDYDHVLVMLSDQMVSVNRFFERPDREKQFLYQLLMQEDDPDAAMANFREMLMRVNSKERYDRLLNSGFQVLLRDDSRTVDETLDIVGKMLKLEPQAKREIRTERLTLRPVQTGDEAAIHEYAGDRDITMMFYLPNETFEETCDFVKRNVEEWNSPDQTDFEFVILYDGKIIGGCDADLSHSEDRSYATLGWIINKKYRNMGFASEAAKALLDFAFENLNVEKVYAQCDTQNPASYKVMMNIGMTCVNDRGTRTYPRTGKVSGEYTCLITKEEWERL